MFLARMVFFRLHESPRYLAHAGRPQEAIESLQLISKFNGSELSLGLDDVAIHVHPPPEGLTDTSALPEDGIRAPLLSNADMAAPKTSLAEEDSSLERPRMLLNQTSRDGLRNGSPPDNEPKDYSATGKSDSPLDPSDLPPPLGANSRSSSFYSTASTSAPSPAEYSVIAKDVDPATSPLASPRTRRRSLSPMGRREDQEDARPIGGHSRRKSTASMYEARSRLYWRFPRWLRKPLWAWFDRVAMVLSPEWMSTTLLVWAAWWAMSLGEFASFRLESWITSDARVDKRTPCSTSTCRNCWREDQELEA